jgi:hypothetical protein
MKTKDMILFLVIASFGLYIFYKVFKKPVKKTIETVKAMSRGLRNKNPGNIRKTYKNGTQTFWKGEVIGNDKDFKTFSSMAYGYRAIFALLKEYIGKGYNTVEKIISRYAPASENKTEAYINTVCKRSGIVKDSKIAASDLVTLTKLVSAISFVENGIAANEVDINDGKKLLM